jgi:hypothetical protein
VIFVTLLQIAEEIYTKAFTGLPLPLGITRAMQRGENQATAHEQSRPECPHRADLDEIDKRFVVGCNLDH